MITYYNGQEVEVDILEEIEALRSNWGVYACQIYFEDGRVADAEIQGNGNNWAYETLTETT